MTDPLCAEREVLEPSPGARISCENSAAWKQQACVRGLRIRVQSCAGRRRRDLDHDKATVFSQPSQPHGHGCEISSVRLYRRCRLRPHGASPTSSSCQQCWPSGDSSLVRRADARLARFRKVVYEGAALHLGGVLWVRPTRQHFVVAISERRVLRLQIF